MDNPYDICTWRPAPECEGCSLDGRLKCRFNLADLLHFLGMFSLFAIPAVVGMVRGGYGRWLVGWAGFCLLFFELWEIRILCSHCPYYAAGGRTLRCIANYGSLKVWRYHPEPINTPEKTQLAIGFIILGGYPFPFLVLGQQLVPALVALCGLVVFFWTLRRVTCSRCVNFSCMLNCVPKELVDAYLGRNPVMRKAWEESGYQVGG
jgi:hypothetical protein